MDYKESLLLPETDFPMRGNLAQNEPKRYQKWFEGGVYEKMKANREGAPIFTLHDGPPYANGAIHLGHALNKILKDIVAKYHYFRGRALRFIPGWDCHGLPIEHQIETKIGTEAKEKMLKNELRGLCREHAAHFIDVQREGFQSLGVIADWKKPYVTMDFAFEANIYRELCRIAEKGLLKERKKPVYWSWAAKSALAEAEVEYQEKEDWSIYVAFDLSEAAKAALGITQGAIIIWTTTPWTLPANMGIALNPHEEYVLTSDGFIVAAPRLEALLAEGVVAGEAVKTLDPKAMERLEAINPLNGRSSLIVLGEHVLMDGGSGCVHTAPGHGEEDYHVWLNYSDEIIMPVDESGCYDRTIVGLGLLPDAESFVAMHVFKANERIVELLREAGALRHASKFTHSYPFCWRTHKPVIYRATKQWFIVMDEPFTADGRTLRQVALDEIEKVTFYPESGRNRLRAMIANRPDWCISRQRDWGVPIAFFRHKATGEVIFDHKVTSFIAMIFEKEGADAWYTRSIEELLYPGSGYNPADLEKVTDILDVWFDSGSTHYAVLCSRRYDAGNFPADVYLEGSDQHRGWFQSSLLVSCATNECAPYKAIITHGFTVDEQGNKMSKSKGNGVEPQDVIKQYGSEILRLWVALSDYQGDMKLGKNILNQVSDQYRKLRNTFRFMLANISDLSAPLPIEKLGLLDRWILSEAKKVFDEAESAFAAYDFAKGFHRINAFLTTELSGIYLDICKDRLYCDSRDDQRRLGAQTAMLLMTRTLLGLVAPVLTYTCDEVVEYAPKVLREDSVSIFDLIYTPLPEIASTFPAAKMLALRELFFAQVDELKKGGVIKNTLEIILASDDPELFALDEREVSDWFLVSAVDPKASGETLASLSHEGYHYTLKRSTAHKCPRCWKQTAPVPEALCARCQGVIG
ncbi:MAG: isoleucine--tRNA ligase [Campylobacterales bacterium]